MTVQFIVKVKDSAQLTKLVSFTFLIDMEIQLNSGDRLCTWKVTTYPTNSSGEFQAIPCQPPSLRLMNTLQSLLEEESHLTQFQESEKNRSPTPDQWHTTPNSPLWDIDTFNLPNSWEGLTGNGTEIEDKFYELKQSHLEHLIEEEEAA